MDLTTGQEPASVDASGSGAAEADLAALPAILVTPPWLKKAKAKAGAGRGKVAGALPPVPPLTLAPEVTWAVGERERLLDSQDYWARELLPSLRKNPRQQLTLLGFDFRNDFPADHPWLREAEAALATLDVDALLTILPQHLAQRKSERAHFRSMVRAIALLALPEETAVRWWNQAMACWLDHDLPVWETGPVRGRFGLACLPGLLQLVAARPKDYLITAMPFGAVEIAPLAARAFARLRTMRAIGREWLLRHPAHAIAGLIAPALGKGEPRDCAVAALRLLDAEGHRAAILSMAARHEREDVVRAVQALLDEDPLDRFPSRRSALPAFWQPQQWHRPVLRSNGAPLPDSALEHLGQMLTFPTSEEVYGGLAVVQAACTPESLSAFLWDCFEAWLAAGAPSRDGWAMRMLGHLGTDDTARRLTPYIRAWPGEAAHARAVSALDVLGHIGSDVALMLLNGIAKKVPFRGLQDKAREKIQAIADERGLTTEELEDRVAPDLGLDEQGTLVLDFGPRQFKVGFDESLKPWVRARVDGRDGPRLKDLPKPNLSDDTALSQAAVARFKQLKKDARMVAGQQVERLEQAMCRSRRWTPDVFEQCLVAHPLVRHLVQRLVWGVYLCEPDARHGGVLQACFRVSGDGGLTDANDDHWTLPEGANLRIGIVHALDMPAADAAAFGQLFADYELLQPFVQLGRDHHALTEAERSATELTRWQGGVMNTGRLAGLERRGWRRGESLSHVYIEHFTKPLSGDRVAEATFSPGLPLGAFDPAQAQSATQVCVGKATPRGTLGQHERFDSIDAVTASELIRDMEALRS